MIKKSVKTYFWKERIISSPRHRARRMLQKNPSNYFVHGNAGDLFTEALIDYLYDLPAQKVEQQGGRLLLTGSISHFAQPKDVLCGIGIKDQNIPWSVKETELMVFGLRGPITESFYRKQGFTLDELKFLLDPGLIINHVYAEKDIASDDPDQVIFIPHYRERFEAKKILPKGIRFVDIDQPPEEIAKQILKSKLVYSSSLHGIIFAHAYDRPCIFVRPQTEEPLLKFEDYYLSVGLDFPKPIDSISKANFMTDSDTPPGLNISPSDFFFPSKEWMEEKEILI